MAVLTGTGFYLSTALGVSGAAANNTVISSSDLGFQTFDYQTNAAITGTSGAMQVGDGLTVDINGNGLFTDETSTTQTSAERFNASTVTFSDGSTATVVIMLVTLSDTSQMMLISDAKADAVNNSSFSVQSIQLGTFSPTGSNYGQSNFTNTITNTISNTVICFTEFSKILTPKGELPAKDIMVGDKVITADKGSRKIVWVGHRKVSSKELIENPGLRPISIKAGALGQGLPGEHLVVSPQHRMVLSSNIIERALGVREILVPAVKLLSIKGIKRVSTCDPVTYIHFLLNQHHVVFANGAPSESMFAGAEALKALSPDAQNEISQLFPGITADAYHRSHARLCVESQSKLDDLLYRHFKNGKQVLDQLAPHMMKAENSIVGSKRTN